MNKKYKKFNGGYSLVEVLIASFIFSLIAIAVYNAFTSINTLVSASRNKIVAIDLLNEQFEIVRNLPFSSVGLLQGIPQGVLAPTDVVVRDGRSFDIVRTIRNVDDPFDGTIGGSPNDLSPADYKLVEIGLNCAGCKNFLPMSATAIVAPKNLESASTNGSLFIRVFDANGNPVPQANVQITNSSAGIDINDSTDNSGYLQVVDAPPSVNSYHVVTSKSGFTTDSTYAATVSNPNPLKPDATVVLQQVTQTSFVIDRQSSMYITTQTNNCSPVSNVDFSIIGTKLIGDDPPVYKWSPTFTSDSSGVKNVSGVEWDSYTFSLSGGRYLAGTNPISPISILPNSSQNINLVIAEGNPNFLLVNVKDASSNLPISGAIVNLSGNGVDENLETDKGFIRQTDWSGGSGQSNFSDPTKYYSSDGNIETNASAGEIKLLNSLGSFVSSGEIVSSVFDTGAPANWSKIDILPTDPPAEAGADSVKVQIATAVDNTIDTVWDFKGPDGTSSSFYTILNGNINDLHDGHRYIRYKIILSTIDQAFSPSVSDISISFSSSCIPPGQVLFSNISNGDDFDLDVTANGYIPYSNNNLDINNTHTTQDVLLSPI